MSKKQIPKYSPEVRERAVRMVMEHGAELAGTQSPVALQLVAGLGYSWMGLLIVALFAWKTPSNQRPYLIDYGKAFILIGILYVLLYFGGLYGE